MLSWARSLWGDARLGLEEGGAMGKEAWTFVNGGGTELKASLEEDDKGNQKLTFEMFNEKLKKVTATIPVNTDIDTKTKIETKGLAKKTQANAYASYAMLYWFTDKKRNKKYGDRCTLESDGRLIVGLYEEHPPDSGINKKHPGCTLLDAGPLKK